MKHASQIQFRLTQVWAVCKLSIAFIIAAFYKHKPLWLICERGIDARDNGYWFFLFLKKEHPEIDVHYIISQTSADRRKLLQYEDSLVKYRSLQHYILLWRATNLISTHIQGYFPFVGLGCFVMKIFPYYRHKKHIFLQHGITKDYFNFLSYDNSKVNLVTAGVQPEYEFFKHSLSYSADNVKLTGFCRFDNLLNTTTKQQLLLMPTWREWIYTQKGFEQSEYAQKYIEFLSNKTLLNLLDQHNMQLIFYPHHEIQPYISYITNKIHSSQIIIADEQHYDVQTLLKESKILITDYSSVFFDFAYMRKPILFYQFDENKFRKDHYQEGWYNYRDGLGPVSTTLSKLLIDLTTLLNNGCQMNMKYQNKIETYFPFFDTCNCERNFQAIINLQ